MKKSIKLAALLVAGVATMVACKQGDSASENVDQKMIDAGYTAYFENEIPTGLYYKFEKENPTAQKVEEGDMIVGEMTVRFDSVELFSNKGQVARIAKAIPNFEIRVGAGLTLLHVGDIAVFAMEADTAAKYVGAERMPEGYVEGQGQKFYYELNVQDIVTKDELAAEQDNYIKASAERKNEEPEAISEYVQENHITAKPTADGLYITIKKRGNGPKVAMGKTVSMNYTGRLLDGTMFDSSVEGDARSGEIYNPQRKYEPLTYVVGKMSLIPGWEKAVMGQPEGTVLQVVIPSALAYGPKGTPDGRILPYSPLVFDIQIVSVK